MAELESQQTLTLTEPQRLVYDAFMFRTTILTINGIRTITKNQISAKTIRRALAKLCTMGLVERVPARKKGRGYSDLYRRASSKDDGVQNEDKDNPLSELEDLVARYKKETQQ